MAEKSAWKRALFAACFAGALVLLKSIPIVGATPWLCAAVDAISLGALLVLTAPYSMLAALIGALLAGGLDFLQGTVPWMLPVSLAVGHFLAAVVWRGLRRIVPRAVLCALTVFAMQWLLVAIGYVLAKDHTLTVALRTAARSRWYAGAWYAAMLAVLAFRAFRRAGKSADMPK